MSSAENLSETLIEMIPLQFRQKVKITHLADRSVNAQYGSETIGVCGQKESAEKVLECLLNSKVQHICQSQGHFFGDEVLAATKMIVSPDQFMKYPLSTILRPNDSNKEKEQLLKGFMAQFLGSEEKEKILSSLQTWLISKIQSQSLMAEIIHVADELFMNAVYNAPFFDAQGLRRPVDYESEEVRKGKGKKATLFAGEYNKQLVIGCTDEYGSLQVHKLLKRIQDCFTSGVYQNINWSQGGGAGIGSFMIYNIAISYYFGVFKGRQTMICCKIPMAMSGRKKMEEPKNLHYFEY